MINKRLFGAPLLPSVKRKLEDRQKVAEKIAPGESVPSHFVTAENENIADLSSRTPAVRMWTSISLINKEITAEIYQEFEIDKNDPDVNVQNYNKLNDLKTRLPGSKIIELEDKMYLKSGAPERDAIKYANKIYVIGNNEFNTHTINPNQSSVNERIEYYSTEMEGGNVTSVTNASEPPEDFTSNQLNTIESAFPQTQKTNQFLKPTAGITSVQSTTEGMVGAIKKTTINFVVHNFNDFDKIYSRYFLKPGATVFIDFGWSTNLFYDPAEFLDDDDPITYLYGEPDKGDSKLGKVTEANGDFEVLQGIVTNYDSQIQMNGSVNCSLTITSPNNALLNFQINSTTKRRIKQILEHGVLYLAVKPTISNTGDINDYDITPNSNTSTEEIIRFNNNLDWLAGKQLGNNFLTPGEQRTPQRFNIWYEDPDTNEQLAYDYVVDTDGGNSIRTGVFVDTIDANEVYISFGLFEDLIVNSQFGFGKNEMDINKGNKFQVRMDSSNTFTYFDDAFINRQKTIAQVDEDPPKFLMPTWWGNSVQFANNSQNRTKKDLGSYNFQQGKYPIDAYEQDDDHVTTDKAKSRIPVREIFINTELILEAFDKEDNVKKVIEYIIREINKDSHQTLDLDITSGATDSEIQIIDKNFLQTQSDIDEAGSLTEGDNNDKDNAKNTKYEELFKFNATSGNSIIKGYDVSFDIPTGNIGNMYAINAMSHEDRIFPLDEMLDSVLSTSALDDSLSFIYEPDMSAYRAAQIGSAGDADATLVEIYDRAKDLTSSDTYHVNAVRTTNDNLYTDEGIFSNFEWHPGSPESKQKEKQKKTKADKDKEYENQRLAIIDAEIERAQGLGFKVMDTFNNFWMLKISRKIIVEKRPTVLPMKLSITIYGISSIVPGDIFRVDYLPEFYVDKVYFQTIQVQHSVEPTGWYTTLSTQFRIRPSQEKIEHYANLPEHKIILSPKALEKIPLYGYMTEKFPFKFMTKEDFDANSKPFKQLVPYMRNITVKTNHHFQNVDLVLQFEWIKPYDADPNHEVIVEFPGWYFASIAPAMEGDNMGQTDMLDLWGVGYGIFSPRNWMDYESYQTTWEPHANYQKLPQNNHLPGSLMKEETYYLFIQGKFWAIIPVSRAQRPFEEIEKLREHVKSWPDGPENQADEELQKAVDNYNSNAGYGDMFDYKIKAEFVNSIPLSAWPDLFKSDSPSYTVPENIQTGESTRYYDGDRLTGECSENQYEDEDGGCWDSEQDYLDYIDEYGY